MQNDPTLNTEIGSLIGSGQLQISASSFLAQQFYLIRFDSDGVRIMSTRSTPRTIVLGNNGDVTLFAGDEIQLAQSPQLLSLDAYIRDLLDARISEISGGGGGGGGPSSANIYDYFTALGRQNTFRADVTNVADNADVTAILAAVAANSAPTPVAIANEVMTRGLATEANAVANRTTVLAAIPSADITAIKAKTDQLIFTGANLDVIAQVVVDKTDYTLTAGERADVADAVWDETLSEHQTSGSVGKKLKDNLKRSDFLALK
jgi:hypothetical protein